MKKALKLVCAIGGAAVIWKTIKITWLGGIGFAHGVLIANDDHVTHDDIRKNFLDDGFSFNKAAYFAGVLVGQDEKELANEVFES